MLCLCRVSSGERASYWQKKTKGGLWPLSLAQEFVRMLSLKLGMWYVFTPHGTSATIDLYLLCFVHPHLIRQKKTLSFLRKISRWVSVLGNVLQLIGWIDITTSVCFVVSYGIGGTTTGKLICFSIFVGGCSVQEKSTSQGERWGHHTVRIFLRDFILINPVLYLRKVNFWRCVLFYLQHYLHIRQCGTS